MVAAMIAGLLLAAVAPVSAQSAEERRVSQTRQKVAQVRAALESARARQSTDAEALRDADAHLAAVMEAVGQAEHAVQRQQQAVEEARSQLDDLRQRATEQRQTMRNRAVELYKSGGGGGPVDALLAASNPADAVRRSSYIDLVASSDRRSLEGVSASGVAVDAQRTALEAEEASLQRVLDQQQQLHAEVADLRNDRALVFAASSQQVAQLESQERHLDAENRELASLARRSSRAAPVRTSRGAVGTAGVAPAPQVGAGGWVWPARGPVTSEYGPRWGRQHQGIDIGAATGSAIVAARPGTVTHAGSMGGYGAMTLIDHGGGITTAYAHQSAIMVRRGQQVGAGERIGSVGCSGSCTGPHLHFEVRVNGSARNPRGYLN
ncbi:MAG: peptidoglycan DD-metalloendopeptidase family protein [Egibacteraceae bacterium]